MVRMCDTINQNVFPHASLRYLLRSNTNHPQPISAQEMVSIKLLTNNEDSYLIIHTTFVQLESRISNRFG